MTTTLDTKKWYMKIAAVAGFFCAAAYIRYVRRMKPASIIGQIVLSEGITIPTTDEATMSKPMPAPKDASRSNPYGLTMVGRPNQTRQAQPKPMFQPMIPPANISARIRTDTGTGLLP